MRKLKIGILGAANIARKSLIPAALKAENAEIVALASLSDKGATFLHDTNLRTKDGQPLRETVRLTSSYEELLADPGVDAVYIPLPNHMHKEWSLKAADAGKHVLCEKPAALNATEAQTIISHCNDRGVVWMEAFMYRFHPQYELVRRWVETGVIGSLRTVRSSFTFQMSPSENTRWVQSYGGGSLYDVGCYSVNVSQFLIGRRPKTVSGMMVETKDGVDEDFLGMMDYGDNQMALFHSSFAQPHLNSVEVFGTTGSIYVPEAFIPGTKDAELVLRTNDKTSGSMEKRVIVPGCDEYQRQVDAFARCVFEGRKPDVMSHEDTIDNMRTIDALYKSAREQKMVRL